MKIRVNNVFQHQRGDVRCILSSARVICIHIDINIKKQRDPNFDSFPVRVNVVQFDPLPPTLQVFPHQLQCLICEAISSEFCKQQGVAYEVKRLNQFNSEERSISLSVGKTQPPISYHFQHCSTTRLSLKITREVGRETWRKFGIHLICNHSQILERAEKINTGRQEILSASLAVLNTGVMLLLSHTVGHNLLAINDRSVWSAFALWQELISVNTTSR